MFIFLQLFLIQPRVILQGRAQLRVSVQQVQHQLQRVPAQETHFIIILYLLNLTGILFYKVAGVYILHEILLGKERGENEEINSPENIISFSLPRLLGGGGGGIIKICGRGKNE